jgi:hypothetical protein
MNYLVNLLYAMVFVPIIRLFDVYESVVLGFWEAHREDEGIVEHFEAIEDLLGYFQRTWMGKQVHIILWFALFPLTSLFIFVVHNTLSTFLGHRPEWSWEEGAYLFTQQLEQT